MQIFEKDIAIDMGTSTTLLFEAGKGIVAREPTVVAIDKFNGKSQKVGQDAQKMLGRTPANIIAVPKAARRRWRGSSSRWSASGGWCRGS